MIKRRTENRRPPATGKAAVRDREPTPAERKRFIEVVERVIERRRGVLENLAKH